MRKHDFASDDEYERGDLIEKARYWASIDPNAVTSNYVLLLLENSNYDELGLLFGRRIEFGTAGLRAKMQPGPSSMNDLIVIQTSQGIARYCQKKSSSHLRCVIGYDHRSKPKFRLSSHRFALLAREVFLSAGFDEVILLHKYVATPIISFSTIALQAACGIMVTASHNPKDDCGYKVYWNDGCQIRPPMDEGMKEQIMLECNLKPWKDYEVDDSYYGDELETSRLVDLYFKKMKDTGLITGRGKKACDLVREHPNIKITIPKIAYTPMHGVGLPWAQRSFQEFGLPPFVAVCTQVEPDPNFPTVKLPNPEEKGALNVAMKFCEENDLDIILANDPDADRLAVAEKVDGMWETFSGDQCGVMLGHWLWHSVGKSSEQPIAMCASTVSSSMLSQIARVEGFHFEDTLTGFKWIGDRVLSLRRQKCPVTNDFYRVIFSYEEAIGFCCGEIIPDKDGVSAVSVFAELIYDVYITKKITLRKHMQSLYDKYGEFASHNGYYFYDDPKIPQLIFDYIRDGGNYHAEVCGYRVSSIRDLGSPGYDSTTDDNKPILPTSSSSPMLTIKFDNGGVFQFRCSGTEPKFKFYVELAGEIGKSRDEVQNELKTMADAVLNALVRPRELGLT